MSFFGLVMGLKKYGFICVIKIFYLCMSGSENVLNMSIDYFLYEKGFELL